MYIYITHTYIFTHTHTHTAKQETRVWSLGREAPLEKEMATHPSILAWRIPWTEEPGGLQSTGPQRVGHDLATKEQQKQDRNGLQWFFKNCPADSKAQLRLMTTGLRLKGRRNRFHKSIMSGADSACTGATACSALLRLFLLCWKENQHLYQELWDMALSESLGTGKVYCLMQRSQW